MLVADWVSMTSISFGIILFCKKFQFQFSFSFLANDVVFLKYSFSFQKDLDLAVVSVEQMGFVLVSVLVFGY